MSSQVHPNPPIPFRADRQLEALRLKELALIVAIGRIAEQRGCTLKQQVETWEFGE